MKINYVLLPENLRWFKFAIIIAYENKKTRSDLWLESKVVIRYTTTIAKKAFEEMQK